MLALSVEYIDSARARKWPCPSHDETGRGEIRSTLTIQRAYSVSDSV